MADGELTGHPCLEMLAGVQTRRQKWSAGSRFGLWSQEGFTEEVTFELGTEGFPLKQEGNLQERRPKAKAWGLRSSYKVDGSGVI